MGLALAVLFFVGVITTIGKRLLQALIETPRYIGDTDQFRDATRLGNRRSTRHLELQYA